MLQAKINRPNLKSVCLAFGSNHISQPLRLVEEIQSSYALLSKGILVNCQCSSFYQTPAFPKGNGPDYVNSAMIAQTELSPNELLAALHDVENQLGRTREARWGARVIDIDLLSYDDCVLPSLEEYKTWRDMPLELQKITWPDGLILPHPRIQDRGFVLIPLQAVSPNWVHPVTSETIETLIKRIDPQELREIVQISDI